MNKEYEPDKIWSSMRREHNIDLQSIGSLVQLQETFDNAFRRDKYLNNLGSEGRQQLMQVVIKEWQQYAPAEKLSTLMALRERGIISAGEYHEFARQIGIDESDSERQYKQWEGSLDAVFTLKEKDVLLYGEYSQLIKAKSLSRGQAWYRWRRWQEQQGIRPLPKRIRRQKTTQP